MCKLDCYCSCVRVASADKKTISQTDDHGIDFGPAFGLSSNINSPVGGSTNSASGSRYTSTYNTANAQQSRAQPDSFAALLSAVVQDATNSGILQMPNSVSAGPISQPTASNARHKRAVSLAQMVEQQQKQLHGNIVLNHNQHRISSQRSPYQQSLATSPSLLPYPPFSSPRELNDTPPSGISRQPQFYSRNMVQQNATNFRSPSAMTSGSNITLHGSAVAYVPGHGSQSGASSVVQTPSPLLDATASNFASNEIRVASASSSELADCPAKKVTKSDCHDHAHVRGQPVLHVCHWQNCHASFTTVQNLLQHISQSHLGLNMGIDASEASSPMPNQQDTRLQSNVTLAQDSSEQASLGAGLHLGPNSQPSQRQMNPSGNPDAASVFDNMLRSSTYKSNASLQSADGQPINQHFVGMINPGMQQSATASNSSDAQFASSGNINMDGSLGLQFQTTTPHGPTPTSFISDAIDAGNGGPMACLWDDCPPFDPFAHFGQQCLDDACGILPSDIGNTALNSLPADQPVDARMLTCDPSCTQDHAHLFPCEPSCNQAHTHVYPMHLHTYSPVHPSHPHNVQLDSATAVLKHLLQQHLGVDLTQGLLNVASQQMGDAPAVPTANNGHTSSTSSAPVTRRPSTEKHACSGTWRQCKPLRAPPRKAADEATADFQTHVCRWHGCTQTFGSVEDLTEHLSDIHIGKGKTEYECLWAGCETCEAGKSADDEQTPRGRKFTTRQKVMRHMQAGRNHRQKYLRVQADASLHSFYRHIPA